MIYLIQLEQDLTSRGEFLFSRPLLEEGYFPNAEEAQRRADILAEDAYSSWKSKEEVARSYYEEIRNYPELLQGWERELLGPALEVELPELDLSMDEFRLSGSYRSFSVIGVRQASSAH